MTASVPTTGMSTTQPGEDARATRNVTIGTTMSARPIHETTARRPVAAGHGRLATIARRPPTPNSHVRERVEKYARLTSCAGERPRECTNEATVAAPSSGEHEARPRPRPASGEPEREDHSSGQNR